MITFNNIVERFEVFATNHFFIKSFSFGSPDDVDLSKFEEFPLMHLVYTGATYDAGTKTYNLEVYILDVPNDKKGKVIPQKEAISDAEQCAEDIIADIRSGGNIFLFAEDYEVVNATTTPLEEETKNVLSGILLDISVAIPYEWDACNAPIDGVTPGGGEVVYARRGVLRMLTLDGSTDVLSVRTIKVTNGTLTDDGDGVVTLDTGGVETLEALTDVTITNAANGQVIKYLNGIWINAADGGAISLNDLTDVIISQPESGDFFRYDGDEWVNDTANKSDVGLGNVDNTSDANKPVSTATQTALDLKADITSVPTELDDLNDVKIVGTPSAGDALVYQSGFFQLGQAGATELGDLDDVSTAGAAFGSLLTYNGSSWVVSAAELPTDDIYFHQRYETESEALRTGATATVELYFTCTAQGNGLAESASSDTPTAGYVINRKIYYSEEGFADPDTATWIEFSTLADDITFANAKAAILENLKLRTGGTVPISLKQTWEEVAAAPSFTGLLNETYGSGAAAAYSTRRLNGLYSGDCMTIRRASDSTTTTIGFDGSGNISEADIISFCTGTTCTVYQWLDQSTNDNHATAASGQEPTIYTGGAIVKIDGRTAMTLDGSNDGFTTSSNIVGAYSIFTLGNPTASGYYSDSTSGSRQYIIRNSSIAGSFSEYQNGTATNNIYDFRKELVAYISNSATTRVINTLLTRYNFVQSYNGDFSEYIIYTTDKSGTDQTSIEENIGDYFTQNTPLLDTYTGAAAAYSLRLLRTAYTGDAVEVYNGSAYADIGFNVFGELDTVALAAHCGTNSGYVSKWYDQSGNTNTAAQTVTGSMPKIYDGTTGVVTENGKPAVEYDNDVLIAATSATITSESVMIVATQSATGRWNRIVSQNATGTNDASSYIPCIRWDNTSNIGGFDGSLRSTGAFTYDQQFLFEAYNTGSALTNYFDTVAGSASSYSLNETIGELRLGNGRGVGASEYLIGNLQEVIVYHSDQSATATRTGIETNINTFYDIF